MKISNVNVFIPRSPTHLGKYEYHFQIPVNSAVTDIEQFLLCVQVEDQFITTISEI